MFNDFIYTFSRLLMKNRKFLMPSLSPRLRPGGYSHSAWQRLFRCINLGRYTRKTQCLRHRWNDRYELKFNQIMQLLHIQYRLIDFQLTNALEKHVLQPMQYH